MNKVFSAIAVVALMTSSMVANAGLMGATVNQTFYYPSQSSLYCDNGNAVVSAGVEYVSGCSGFGPVVTDITDTQLIVDTGGIGWAGGAFNGFLLSTLTGFDIVSAIFNSGSMNATSLTVDNGNLWVNFSGQSGGRAVFDIVTSGTSVPEPMTLSLLGVALAGLVASRRSKK